MISEYFLFLMFKKIYEKIVIFLKEKVVVFLKEKFMAVKAIISTSYGKARNGEEEFKNVLYYWCLIPDIIYFISLKFIGAGVLKFIIDIFMMCLSILGLYFIAKALKVHPEYDSIYVKELEKEEYYKTLTEEQVIEAKKKEKKDNAKKLFRKYIFLKYDDKVDLFRIVRIVVIITLLISLRRIFF